MNLTDREILELNELCGAVVDGTLTETQRERLQRWLAGSEAARRYYVRAMGQSASLHQYAAEVHADLPEPVRPLATGKRVLPFPIRWAAGLAAAAATIVGAFWLARPSAQPTPPPAEASPFIARLTAARESRWAGAHALQPGEYLRSGQTLELLSGYAEITFDSGARVVLEGATSLHLQSAWDATLQRGTLKANVPPEAIGFRVLNSEVEVIDLGTEFTMVADGRGSAEVFVLKGEVEAAPRTSPDLDTILLRENEGRRFAAEGVSLIADSDEKFARFGQALNLERFAPMVSYVHWSFDETSGSQLRATGPGAHGSANDARLEFADDVSAAASHTEGPHGRALRFNGEVIAKASLPGISGSTSRTIAFWVKIPDDAQPIDTWMVGWMSNLQKLSFRPVHISWNRRPSDGPLGALRTDFAGGNAIGTTSLRDGKWHHVAIYFAPGEALESPIDVKQYVDGRLESSTIVPGTVRAPAGERNSALADQLWLGYRLTGKKTEGRRFLGEIDELFVADRRLEPFELVALMKDNRLPAAAMVATVSSEKTPKP